MGDRTATSSQHGDEEAIRRVIVEMTDAFNRHDANAATAMYRPDADLVTVRGERYKGSDGMRNGLAGIFATRARHATLRTLGITVRFLGPDVAIAHVLNELSGLVSARGEPLPAHEELSLRVFVRDGELWSVAAFHNTLVRPFSPEA